MAKVIVATVDEIADGGRKIVEVSGRAIGIFNIGGEFFALRSQCPHQGGPLCEGKLSGLLESDRPGEYQYSRDSEILRCPWHGWEFDIRTGQSWIDPLKTRVRSYDVSLEEGADLAAERDTSTERQKGPYVAETYDVSIEEQYVVVEI